MRKKQQGRKFQRKTGQRKSLLRGLARELFLREKIQTTEAKAKELKRVAEKLITRAKKGDLASRRSIAQHFSKSLTKKIVDELSTRYKSRPGGYTRIIKLGPRKSDGAEMVIIELVK